MKMNLRILVFLFACLTISSVAKANLNGSLTVNATMAAGCTNVSTSPVNFGTISAGTHEGVGDITVTCLSGVGYSIKIGTPGFDCNQDRLMQGFGAAAGFTIPYKLYRDSQLTSLWGADNSNNCSVHPDVATGSPQPHTVYGRATPLSVPAGYYEDTLQVEIGF